MGAPLFREVAQLGSAPGLGPGGRRFESCLLDHCMKSTSIYASFFYFLITIKDKYGIILLGDKMKSSCIYNIDFKTNNNETISISSDYFDHFYICNLDNDGNEIGYSEENGLLVANFMMMKINDIKKNALRDLIDNLKSKKNISFVELCFTNGYKQKFKVPKKRVVKDGKMQNLYESFFEFDDSLGIIITDKNLKYEKGLFI